MAFDSVHDQRAPAEVLRRVRSALSPGGMFVMVDAKFSSRLENNVGNPFAPLCYAISLLADAGFGDVAVVDSPRPQNCLYVCRV
jgi:hypothetical protein